MLSFNFRSGGMGRYPALLLIMIDRYEEDMKSTIAYQQVASRHADGGAVWCRAVICSAKA